MSQIYDNWDRLVRSTLRREKLRLIALRTPSLSPSPSSSWSPRSSPSTTSSSPPSLSKLPSLLIGEAFDYGQILRASNNFSNSNFIKRGRSGEFFHGVLDDGTRVVIKKVSSSSPYCVSELQAFGIGKDSHTSLVPLLGHCSDGFLVYKYMSMGDLSSLLLRRKIDPHDVSLDWISRLKIAVGTAEALCYLHHECSPPLVHRDIQASSIFLDDDYQVRLGSLGNVCALVGQKEEEEKKAKKQNNTMRFLRPPKVPKEISYEQGTSGKPAYDVYCFGKVLLELIRRRRRIGATYQDLRQELRHYIRPYDNKSDVDIGTHHLIVDELFDIKSKMAFVARCCLNPNSPPSMKKVLKALESPLEFVLLNVVPHYNSSSLGDGDEDEEYM